MNNCLTNLQNPLNKLVKSVVINFSVNDCLGNYSRTDVQEYNLNSQNSLTGQTCLHIIHEAYSVLL